MGARQEKRAAMDALYAELPTMKCRGLCFDHCGPIVLSAEEWQRIKERKGNVQAGPDHVCPMLNPAGRCTVYEIRPMICRLWGVVDSMRCPHGCKPEAGYLTVEEGFDFLARAEGISGGGRHCVDPEVEVRLMRAFGRQLPVVLVR